MILIPHVLLFHLFFSIFCCQKPMPIVTRKLEGHIVQITDGHVIWIHTEPMKSYETYCMWYPSRIASMMKNTYDLARCWCDWVSKYSVLKIGVCWTERGMSTWHEFWTFCLVVLFIVLTKYQGPLLLTESWTCINIMVWIKEIYIYLTHWGRVTHICVGKLTIIGSDKGLPSDWRQAIIWTNAEILLIGTNFNDILIEIYTFSFRKMHLKMLSGKWRPFCLALNVLKQWDAITHSYHHYKQSPK